MAFGHDPELHLPHYNTNEPQQVFMANKLVQPPIPSFHVVPAIPRITKMREIPATHSWCNITSSSGFRPSYTIKVAEHSSNVVGDDKDTEEDEEQSKLRTVAQVKADLFEAVQGINRGIFGVPSAKKAWIEGLVKLLEAQNPTPNPTLSMEKVSGCWRLVYSTITILGSKRTKLGLRDFISLGDFIQIINVAEGKAANVIKFNVRGLNLLNGQLTVEASFKIASTSRVDIFYENSTITPNQLLSVFRKNYDLLLSIFNPEGWLEITYIDESTRVGRDDKGNIFLLERSEE